MNELERINQYELLDEKLSDKITDIIKRHNIICDIIDNGDFELVVSK